MKAHIRRFTIRIFSITLITIALLDTLLYWLDPLGIVALFHGSSTFHIVMINDATGYRLPPGEYDFHNYNTTILPDGSRLIPDNGQGDCAIIAIGDSVTYGQGVADDETWINLLARNFPSVSFFNTGRSDYSAPNVALLKQQYGGDAYIWLHIANDNITAYHYRGIYPSWPYPPAARLYLNWLRLPSHIPRRAVDMDAYWHAMRILATDNTLIFAFDDDALARETTQRYPIISIPSYTSRVSALDPHPDANGHQQIAEAMRPAVTEFVERICG